MDDSQMDLDSSMTEGSAQKSWYDLVLEEEEEEKKGNQHPHFILTSDEEMMQDEVLSTSPQFDNTESFSINLSITNDTLQCQTLQADKETDDEEDTAILGPHQTSTPQGKQNRESFRHSLQGSTSPLPLQRRQGHSRTHTQPTGSWRQETSVLQHQQLSHSWNHPMPKLSPIASAHRNQNDPIQSHMSWARIVSPNKPLCVPSKQPCTSTKRSMTNEARETEIKEPLGTWATDGEKENNIPEPKIPTAKGHFPGPLQTR